MSIVAKTDYAQVAINDFGTFLVRGDRILIKDFGITSQAGADPEMRSDVLATTASRCPALVGHAALLAAQGLHIEADNLLRGVLQTMKDIDPALFDVPPDRGTFVRLLKRMMGPLTAQGHSDRTGPTEARREAYSLSHKFRDENVPEDYVVKEAPRALPKIVSDLKETRHNVALAMTLPDKETDQPTPSDDKKD